MRQVILDTETTGLDASQGHRIIEIGCVELRNRRRTGREFHHYLNPERDIEAGAYGVHGISAQQLADKPRFADIALSLLEFIRDSEVIIHNAPFDVEFLNRELDRMQPKPGAITDFCRIIDSLTLARQLHPGQRNSLDALCARYEVDNSGRDLHGALRDAQLLVDVYLALTGGQSALQLDGPDAVAAQVPTGARRPAQARPGLRLIYPDREELQAHGRRLEEIEKLSGGRCVWLHPPASD